MQRKLYKVGDKSKAGDDDQAEFESRREGECAKFRFIWRPFGGCVKVVLGLG